MRTEESSEQAEGTDEKGNESRTAPITVPSVKKSEDEDESDSPSRLRREWILIAAAVVVSALVLGFSRGNAASPKQDLVTITVVPEDEKGLACSSTETFNGYRCEYAAPNAAGKVADLASQQRVAPYVTVGRRLILLSGVFAYPEVRQETKRRSTLPVKDRRFTIECSTERLAQVNRVLVRFGVRSTFHEDGPAWVEKTTSCSPVIK